MAESTTALKQADRPSATGETGAREAEAHDFFALLKPRVMSLVIFTAFVGLIAAPGTMNPVLAATAILLIAIGAGASGALNMWYDADIDAIMDRTAGRPIPAGRMGPETALGFGMVLSVASVVLLGLAVNITSAVLLALTIFFYVVVYTMWLKRRTPQNIVIGGAAGAFPPVIGWAAATDTVSLESLVLFGIIFLWTPAHFWALSLFISKDYARVGVPMLPLVAGEDETRRQILLYAVLTAGIAVVPWGMGFAGAVYGAVSILLGLVLVALAVQVWRKIEKADRKLFAFSILYLFTIFAVLAGEKIVSRMFA